MAKTNDVETMTIDEIRERLEAAQREHVETVAASKREVALWQDAYDRKEAEARVDAMTDQERAALARYLQPHGVESDASFGKLNGD